MEKGLSPYTGKKDYQNELYNLAIKLLVIHWYENREIVGVYNFEPLFVDKDFVVEEPPVKVVVDVKDTNSDEPGYEQISIFDDMGE